MSDMNKKNIINDSDLEGVTGGMIYNASGTKDLVYPGLPWQVVANNDCRLIGQFSTREEAIRYAQSFGKDYYNIQEVDKATVDRLRANPNT